MRTLLAVARPYRVSLGTAALLAFALTCQDVTVTPVAVQNVAVTPTDTTLTVGEELKLTAVVTDDSGNRLNDRAVTWSSENDDVVSVDATGDVIAVSSGESSVTAAVDGRSGTATIHVMDAEEEVASVEVDPDTASIAVGETVPLEAIARSASGTELEGRDVSWSSSNENVATVDGEGVVTGASAGEATITATVEGVDGDANVTVSLVPVDSVGLDPAEPSVLVGDTVQLEAIALAANGDTLADRAASWESEDPAVATVDDEGLVTGVAEGESEITATVEGVAGSAEVTVSLVPVATVVVDPDETTVEVDSTVELKAVALDADGDTLEGREVSWSSSDAAVASVDGDGVVTGVAAGVATIVAEIQRIKGTAAVTVTAVVEPVATVLVDPDEATVVVDSTVELKAVALDADGDTLEGREVSWSSSDAAVASVDGDGVVTGLAEGAATIKAEIEGEEGTAEVSVLPDPVASVEIEPADTTLAEGDSATLRAIITDANENELPDREVTWESSNTSVATVRGTGPNQLEAMVTAGSCGFGQLSCNAEITATADSVSGTATITVEKIPATVTITPDGPIELRADSTVQLVAEVLDSNDNVLDLPVTWETTDASAAVVNDDGLVTGVGTCTSTDATCTATISATVDGVSDSVDVRVPKPVDVVDVNLSSDTVVQLPLVSQDVTVTATVRAADGMPLPARSIVWNWTPPGTPTSECGEGSGPVRIDLNPTEGTSNDSGVAATTAVVPAGVSLQETVVRIWAEAEGVVGCATLTIVL